MRNVGKLVRDIDRGVGLRENIPIYAGKLAENDMNCAAVELAFSAYLLAETEAEHEEISPDGRQVYSEVMELVGQIAGMGQSDALPPDGGKAYPGAMELAERAASLRKRIKGAMETIVACIDKLDRYNYVLSRIALRFIENSEIEKLLDGELDEEEFLSVVMTSLMRGKERGTLGEQLRYIMGVVPVRITRNKLIDRVSHMISLYQGGDRDALDDFVYKVRSVAMLNHMDESAESGGSEVRALLDRLNRTDFDELDEAAYRELCEGVECCVEGLRDATDFYCLMQRVVNGAYALCLAVRHTEVTSGVYRNCMEVLGALSEGRFPEEQLEKLEGKIEVFSERDQVLGAVLYEVFESSGELLTELGLLDEFEDYVRISMLLSDSLFMELTMPGEQTLVDAEDIRRVSEELCSELYEALGGIKKTVRRAVMAGILRELPVEFRTSEEIEEYIRGNLFHCRDQAEKGASLHDLFQMVSDEGWLDVDWGDWDDFLV